jgi:hypothetical protein
VSFGNPLPLSKFIGKEHNMKNLSLSNMIRGPEKVSGSRHASLTRMLYRSFVRCLFFSVQVLNAGHGEFANGPYEIIDPDRICGQSLILIFERTDSTSRAGIKSFIVPDKSLASPNILRIPCATHDTPY